MKLKKLLLLVLCVATCLSLASCGLLSMFGAVGEEGDVTVVVECADGTYEVYKTYLEDVENKSEGAKGVVEHLRGREENPLTLKMNDTGYGAFVTEIGSIAEDSSSGAYVMVYTSVAEDSYEGAPTVDYDGMTLYQSGVGISTMQVPAGTVILFRLEVYSV